MSRTHSGGSSSMGRNWDAGRYRSRNPAVLLLKCEHKTPAVLETCRKDRNFGRRFYGCQFWKANQGCGFFVWEDELEKHLLEKNCILEEDLTKIRLKLENEQKKRKDSEEEVLALKEEITQLKQGKFSWLKFVVCVFVFVVVVLSWTG